MATITTGTFFLGRKPARADSDGGEFQLTLHVVDRQGPRAVEPYVLRWSGADAKRWWAEHGASLGAGTPLLLTLLNPRSFPGVHSPETHATVQSCALAPVAPSWRTHAQRAGNQFQPAAA
jgi:hypothetical protein